MLLVLATVLHSEGGRNRMIRVSGAVLVLLAVGFALLAYVAPVSGQEPPVGNPPESEDGLQQQIAQMLMNAGSGSGIEEDPQLWALISQLTPDGDFTLGGQEVGSIAELPGFSAFDSGGGIHVLPLMAALLGAFVIAGLFVVRRLVPSA